MSWALTTLLVVVVVLATVAVVLVMRNNQLALARDLCVEALRQVNLQREQRHALVPEYISVAKSCPAAEKVLPYQQLSSALSLAVSANAPHEIGPAEEALTELIDTMATAADVDGPVTEEQERCMVQLHDLYEHLKMVEYRLSAAVRYYNLVVSQYSSMRLAWVSLPLLTMHRRFAHMAYTPNELPDQPDTTLRGDGTETGTDYRPGSVFG